MILKGGSTVAYLSFFAFRGIYFYGGGYEVEQVVNNEWKRRIRIHEKIYDGFRSRNDKFTSNFI